MGQLYRLDYPDFTSPLAGYDLENIMSHIGDPMKDTSQIRQLFLIDIQVNASWLIIFGFLPWVLARLTVKKMHQVPVAEGGGL
ncbi:MAG: hypothetical protein GTN81_11060 [Proteobacteria bacterium]|nr:hypothetical protein [Pseudomonadota bacterium]